MADPTDLTDSTHPTDPTDPFTFPAGGHGGSVGGPARHHSGVRRFTVRRGRALAALAVVGLCLVPAGDALAAGKAKPRVAKPTRTAVSAPAKAPAAAVPLEVEKESVRRGWAWGQAVRGEVVTQGKNGLTTTQLQRGVVTAVTADSLAVTSADGVSITWSVTAGTAVILPRARAVTQTTKGLTVGLAVRVWGLGAGGTPNARLVMADPKAPRPTSTPTLTPTDNPTDTPTLTPTDTPTSTTTSSTTTSDPAAGTDS